MFIGDFVLKAVLSQIIDWLYSEMVGFLGDFFVMMGNMGADLFGLSWIQAIVLFFSYLAWALYVVGMIVGGFEYAIESQNGRGNLRGLAINAIKGFMATLLFATVPIELYKLCVTLQGTFSGGISNLTGGGGGISTMAAAALTAPAGLGMNPILSIFMLIMIGYAVIKVFFANLKRGGILLIQIAVGSLYMFSIPRGYMDGFIQWCKQVIGLCLTAFLQSTMLIIGLMVLNSNMLLGLGLMLSSGEVPRIAGAFGMDTSTKSNFMSTVYATQSIVGLLRPMIKVAAK